MNAKCKIYDWLTDMNIALLLLQTQMFADIYIYKCIQCKYTYE